MTDTPVFLDGKIAAINAELTAIGQRQDALEAANTALGTQLAAAQAALAAAVAARDAALASGTAKSGTIAGLNTQVAALQAQVAGLQAQMANGSGTPSYLVTGAFPLAGTMSPGDPALELIDPYGGGATVAVEGALPTVLALDASVAAAPLVRVGQSPFSAGVEYSFQLRWSKQGEADKVIGYRAHAYTGTNVFTLPAPNHTTPADIYVDNSKGEWRFRGQLLMGNGDPTWRSYAMRVGAANVAGGLNAGQYGPPIKAQIYAFWSQQGKFEVSGALQPGVVGAFRVVITNDESPLLAELDVTVHAVDPSDPRLAGNPPASWGALPALRAWDPPETATVDSDFISDWDKWIDREEYNLNDCEGMFINDGVTRLADGSLCPSPFPVISEVFGGVARQVRTITLQDCRNNKVVGSPGTKVAGVQYDWASGGIARNMLAARGWREWDTRPSDVGCAIDDALEGYDAGLRPTECDIHESFGGSTDPKSQGVAQNRTFHSNSVGGGGADFRVSFRVWGPNNGRRLFGEIRDAETGHYYGFYNRELVYDSIIDPMGSNFYHDGGQVEGPGGSVAGTYVSSFNYGQPKYAKRLYGFRYYAEGQAAGPAQAPYKPPEPDSGPVVWEPFTFDARTGGSVDLSTANPWSGPANAIQSDGGGFLRNLAGGGILQLPHAYGSQQAVEVQGLENGLFAVLGMDDDGQFVMVQGDPANSRFIVYDTATQFQNPGVVTTPQAGLYDHITRLEYRDGLVMIWWGTTLLGQVQTTHRAAPKYVGLRSDGSQNGNVAAQPFKAYTNTNTATASS